MSLNIPELVDKIKATTSKEQLEKLMQDELEIDIDKRRKLEDLKAELVDGLVSDTGDNTHQQLPNLDKGRDLSESEYAPDAIADMEHPTAKPKDIVKKREPKVSRVLENTRTGRRFIWTPTLAKLSHMKEV